jgi:hypothetical protein
VRHERPGFARMPPAIADPLQLPRSAASAPITQMNSYQRIVAKRFLENLERSGLVVKKPRETACERRIFL